MRSRLSYANIMATIAVFIALGGTSYAAVSINGATIKKKSIPLNRLKGTLPEGDRGPRGAKGDDGLVGLAGATGAAGAAGPKGDTGATGATGATGGIGGTGFPGAPGLTGPKGDTGPTGAKGDQGEKGDTGAVGPSTAYRFSNYVGPMNQSSGAEHEVARLSLPTGAYVVSAKVTITSAYANMTAGTVTCTLHSAYVADSTTETLNYGDRVTMVLQATYAEFPATAVRVDCESTGQSWSASSTSLTAIKVGNVIDQTP